MMNSDVDAKSESLGHVRARWVPAACQEKHLCLRGMHKLTISAFNGREQISAKSIYNPHRQGKTLMYLRMHNGHSVVGDFDLCLQ